MLAVLLYDTIPNDQCQRHNACRGFRHMNCFTATFRAINAAAYMLSLVGKPLVWHVLSEVDGEAEAYFELRASTMWFKVRGELI